MSRPNYRVLVAYDDERKVFTARVPELPPCVGEGATRSEALLNMERELDALLQNLADSGGRIPAAIDELPPSGELTVKLSRSLHRDLAFQAQVEGVELNQFLAELLATALAHRQESRGFRPHRRPQSQPNENAGNANAEEQPPRRGERGHGGERFERNEHEGRWRGERNTAARFHGLLEDRASFMEYVRGLESEGGYGRGPRSGQNAGPDRGGGRRGPHHGGGGQGQGRNDRDRPPRDRGSFQKPGHGGDPTHGAGPGGGGPGSNRDGGGSGSAPPT